MRRRLSIALIAATTSALAITTPALAEETADPTHSTTVEPGSTFMGPGDLARSILGGYGSSGVPAGTDAPAAEGEEDEPVYDLEEIPEWMHGSVEPSAEVQLVMAIIGAIGAVAAVSMQVLVSLAPVIGVDRLREIAAQFGIRV